MFKSDEIVSFNADSQIPLPSVYAIDSPMLSQQDFPDISQPKCPGNELQPTSLPNDEDYQSDDIYMEEVEESDIGAPQSISQDLNEEEVPQHLNMNPSSFPQLHTISPVPGN